MPKFTDVLYVNYYRPYRRHLLITLTTLVFIGVGFTIFYMNKSRINPVSNTSDIPNAQRRNSPCEILFFNANWCPHCKRAKTEWVTFVNKYDGEVVGNYTIQCVGGADGINCTETSDPNIQEMIQRYSIEHYPTVKMKMDDDIIEFDAKITMENLTKYVTTVVGQ